MQLPASQRVLGANPEVLPLPLPLHHPPAPRLLSTYCSSRGRTQSGCVGLASSATFLFVLGAGQTIYLEEADSVVALREEGVS